MLNHYIEMPKELFCNNIGKNIIQECDYNFKVVEILSYLYINTNRKNITMFTLEDMIVSCGYKIKRGENKTNEQFKIVLNKLKELGIIVSDLDFVTIKLTQLIKCTLELPSKDLVRVYKKHKEKIYSIKGIDNIKLYTYYCYLIANNINDLRNIKQHENKLNIKNDTIKKYNNILCNLGLTSNKMNKS